MNYSHDIIVIEMIQRKLSKLTKVFNVRKLRVVVELKFLIRGNFSRHFSIRLVI